MKLPQRVHYGLVFLMQLHFRQPEFMPVKEVAQKESLPQKFLEGIAVDLRNGGFVNVKRGARGGYRLARVLKEVSLMEVIRCLAPEWEKQLSESEIQSKRTKIQCVELFLDQTAAAVVDLLEKVTLEGLLTLYAKERSLMYYI